MPDSMEVFDRFISVMESRGWRFVRAVMDDHKPNPEALRVGDSVYPTLISADGMVKVGLSRYELYYHNGKVWRADSSFAPPDLVTLEGLVVDPSVRRRGVGTRAVKDLFAAADASGARLLGHAVPMGMYKAKGQRTINVNRLIRWYMSLGFVPAYPEEGHELLQYLPKTAKNPDDEYTERLRRAYMEKARRWISFGRVGPGMKGILLADGQCVVWNAKQNGYSLGHMEVYEDALRLLMPDHAEDEADLYGIRPSTNSIFIALSRRKGQDQKLRDLEFMQRVISCFDGIRPDTEVIVQVEQYRLNPKHHPTLYQSYRVLYKSSADDLENWELIWDEWSMGWPVGTTKKPQR